MRPSRIAIFSSCVLRCFGAATIVASTIWPLNRQEARSPQSLIEPKEQSVDRAGLSKSLTKRPDRIRIGNRIGQANPKKTHERQPVLNQIFAALIREGMHRLQDQHLEHEHMVKRRTPALQTIRTRNRSF